MWIYQFVLVFVMLYSVSSEEVNDTWKLPLKDCLHSDTIVSCLAEKAASVFETSMNSNIHLLEGVELLRNSQKINPRRAKSLDSTDRFLRTVSDFIDTHTFSIDLTRGRSLDNDEDEETARRRGGGSGGGGGGMFSVNRKALRREKGYYQYAFMVLLGIFGLTGPLFMKVLGIMAAQSLLAAKAALIIVGGVALKKIFENGKPQQKVKVTTVPLHGHGDSDEEHDRLSYSFNHIPYGYAAYGNRPYHDPYAAHYPSGNSVNEDGQFAPIFYGTHKTQT